MVLVLPTVCRAITSLTSGDYMNGATWSGGIAPTNAGDSVTILAGHTVYMTNGEQVLDINTITINSGGQMIVAGNGTYVRPTNAVIANGFLVISNRAQFTPATSGNTGNTLVGGSGVITLSDAGVSNWITAANVNPSSGGRIVITNGAQWVDNCSWFFIGGKGPHNVGVYVGGTNANGVKATLSRNNHNPSWTYVGGNSASDTNCWIMVDNGGMVTNLLGIGIGFTDSGNQIGNYIVVTNGGQMFVNGGIDVGRATTGAAIEESLKIVNGGEVFAAGTVTIGNGTNSVRNHALICGRDGTGNKSLLNMGTKNLAIGASSSVSNWLTIGGGGLVTNAGVFSLSQSNDLRYVFDSRGTGYISCTNATLAGSLSVSIEGGMALLDSDSFQLMRANSFSGDFEATNSRMFSISRLLPFEVATLSTALQASASTLLFGKGIDLDTATNAGWIAVSTNGMPGSTFEMPVLVDTNTATHTVEDLAAYLNQHGVSATNRIFRGYNLFLTLNTPTVDTSYFTWDFSDFDSNIRIGKIRSGSVPASGTVMFLE